MSLPVHPLVLPQPGRYRHYTGSLHDVLGTARHAESGALLVICRPAVTAATMGDAIPIESWNTPVRIDGKTVPRFVKVASPGELERWEIWP